MTGPKRFKVCKACGESKPVDDFYRRRSGYLSWLCKTCTTIQNNAHKAEKRRLAREARAALPPTTTKACRSCGEVKDLNEFHRRRKDSDTRVSACKECSYAAAKQRYEQFPERRARRCEQAAEWAEANRYKIRAKNLARYDITPERYDAMYDAQNGECAICRQSGYRLGTGGEANRSNVLCVDHNHDTNQVRGLLCQRCNRSIGMLGDDRAVLKAAISYLQQSEEL